MSLYEDYISERLGDGIIERDYGFVTYRFLNGGASIYIVDIFVRASYRNRGLASRLADEVCQIGKKKEAKELLGTVVPSARHSTESLKVLLGYGMKLLSASQDLIVFRKDI